MRVGLIAPPWTTVPPLGYGGVEAVVDYLGRGLQRLGHEVTVFTLEKSTVPVQRRSFFDEAPAPMGMALPEAAHVLAAYEELGDRVDLIHDHTTVGPLIAGHADLCRVPVVATHHHVFSRESRHVLAHAARHAHVVAISYDQAHRSGDVPIAAVIHHGIDLARYRPGLGTGGYLLFVGRMSPDKGLHRAIPIARRAGLPLRIVSTMRSSDERRYFADCVRPLLRGGDDFSPDEISLEDRLRLLRDARALVNPISWPEPFGLVMAESLASATPVVAYHAGAAPEIVDDGVTGFLCGSVKEAAAAAVRTQELDRSSCRESAVRRFSMERMALEHDALYRRVLAGRPRPAVVPAQPTGARTAVGERRGG